MREARRGKRVGSGGQQNITKLPELYSTHTANGKGSYALLLLLDAGLKCVEFLQGDEGNTKSASEKYESISSIVTRRRHPTALGYYIGIALNCTSICAHSTCILVRTRHTAPGTTCRGMRQKPSTSPSWLRSTACTVALNSSIFCC